MEKLHSGFVDKIPGNVDKIGFWWLNAAVLLKNKDKDYENFTSSSDTPFIFKHDECSGKKDQR
ncbi:putative sporulation protein YyaC [Chryseobacterium sp. StRB126]|uniref:hypothetical protein n=1 Tax=Chryseobacterium sp. StRB126 TaxID=878220 RepID=UPI0004E987EE|nr:hypothetical protein [Chryseobacterium sp. StRB126]BAP30372.1 putative sporulation protein YyaC [Chryseobacterium sp. StRB126]